MDEQDHIADVRQVLSVVADERAHRSVRAMQDQQRRELARAAGRKFYDFDLLVFAEKVRHATTKLDYDDYLI